MEPLLETILHQKSGLFIKNNRNNVAGKISRKLPLGQLQIVQSYLQIFPQVLSEWK